MAVKLVCPDRLLFSEPPSGSGRAAWQLWTHQILRILIWCIIYTFIFITYRSTFEEVTKMSTSQHIMMTRKNTPLGSCINSAVNATQDIFNLLPNVSYLSGP